MPEHERTDRNKPANANQKPVTRQQKSQPQTDAFHEGGNRTAPLTETPYHPQMDEHAAILSGDPLSAQRHQSIMRLQQTYGNRYVQRLIESMGIQARLTVSTPGDVYEQEADRTAGKVVTAINSQVQRQEEEEELQMKPASGLLRQEEEEEELQLQEEEEELQMKPVAEVQLQEEEEEELQTKPILQRQVEEEEEIQTRPLNSIQLQADEEEEIQTGLMRQEEEEEVQMQPAGLQPAPVSEDLEQRISSARGGGQPLTEIARGPMEQAFGADFGEVRVHTGKESDDLNRQLSARAFTTGKDIFFREGEYSPGSDSGRELLAHELTHVVQQTGAQAAMKGLGTVLNMPVTQKTSLAVQRDVAVGGDLPELMDLNLNAFYSRLPRDKTRKIEKEVLDEKKNTALAAVRSAATRRRDRPRKADANTVVEGFKNKIDTENAYHPAYLKAWHDAGLTAKGKYHLLNKLLDHLQTGINPKLRTLYPSLDESLKERQDALGEKVGQIPDKKTRKKFAAALKSMPGLKSLLASLKKGKKASPTLTAEWKDGGLLTDKIEEKEDTGVTLVRTDMDNGKFSQRVLESDSFFKQIVQPDLLNTIARPKIIAHLRQSIDNDPVNGFRAYYSGNEVHVAQDDAREYIVHEIGHHIEGNLPLEAWQSIQLLLRSRHAGAGGGTAAAIDTTTEARYKGEFPATGEYTGRAYEGEGATEVLSMTVQFLSEPKRFESTLEKDPQQVAVIIRALRPKEYAGHDPLRPFDSLLP